MSQASGSDDDQHFEDAVAHQPVEATQSLVEESASDPISANAGLRQLGTDFENQNDEHADRFTLPPSLNLDEIRSRMVEVHRAHLAPLLPEIRCRQCNGLDHKAVDCPVEAARANNACTQCYKKGHIKRNCTACRICKRQGHHWKACHAYPEKYCISCDETGHYALHCRNRPAAYLEYLAQE